jgi:hypothetical protein
MKIRTLASILTTILTIMLISSCATTPEYISPGRFNLIEIGVLYEGERIAADNERLYRFTPPSSGVYTISVTGVDSDLDWELHDNAEDAYMYEERSIIATSENFGTVDEVGRTPVLNAGQEYYLIVLEYDDVSGDYDLIIKPGRQ